MTELIKVVVAFTCVIACIEAKPAGGDKLYKVIIDAGSSGSRVRVYETPNVDRVKGKLPAYDEIDNKKVEPGISQFKVTTLDDIEPYLKPLIDFAKSKIPESCWAETPIYLMATAGMRLLLEPRANAVMDEIQRIFADDSVCPFTFEDNNARILSGEEEASFAWIAVNYLKGYFDDPENQESTGIVEMGGASTQIAFLPEGSILADKFPVQLADRTYPLYAFSYLFYGQNTAGEWIDNLFYAQDNDDTTVNDPCMPSGDTQSMEIDGKTIEFVGTSDPQGCIEAMGEYVYSVPPYHCHPKPCAVGSIYQPTMPKDMDFVGLSVYAYSTKSFGVAEKDGTFTPETMFQAAQDICKLTGTEVREHLNTSDEYIDITCLMGYYVPTLLTDGYGFADDTRQIKAKFDINGQPAEWTLGAVIYEGERSALKACDV